MALALAGALALAAQGAAAASAYAWTEVGSVEGTISGQPVGSYGHRPVEFQMPDGRTFVTDPLHLVRSGMVPYIDVGNGDLSLINASKTPAFGDIDMTGYFAGTNGAMSFAALGYAEVMRTCSGVWQVPYYQVDSNVAAMISGSLPLLNRANSTATASNGNSYSGFFNRIAGPSGYTASGLSWSDWMAHGSWTKTTGFSLYAAKPAVEESGAPAIPGFYRWREVIFYQDGPLTRAEFNSGLTPFPMWASSWRLNNENLDKGWKAASRDGATPPNGALFSYQDEVDCYQGVTTDPDEIDVIYDNLPAIGDGFNPWDPGGGSTTDTGTPEPVNTVDSQVPDWANLLGLAARFDDLFWWKAKVGQMWGLE